MGRGIGPVQQEILNALAERNDWSIEDLTMRVYRALGVYDADPSVVPIIKEIHYSTVRRSMRNLALHPDAKASRSCATSRPGNGS